MIKKASLSIVFRPYTLERMSVLCNQSKPYMANILRKPYYLLTLY